MHTGRGKKKGELKMDKYVFFAFKGEMMCFMHVMLNALDINSKGYETKIVMEGEAVRLIKELEESGNPMYTELKEKGIFDCICKACSAKMGVLDYNSECGIPLGDEMQGHPAMGSYIEKGYEIITL